MTGALLSSIVFIVGSSVAFGLGEVDCRVGEFLQHRVSGFTFDLPVVLVDRPLDRLFRGQCGFDLAIEDESQFFDGFQVEGVRDQDPQRAVFVAERQDHVFAGDRFGDQFDDLVRNPFLAKIDKGDFVEFGESQGDFFGCRVFQLDQDVADINAGFFGDVLGFGQLIKADDASFEQQIGEVLDRLAHRLTVVELALKEQKRAFRLTGLRREIAGTGPGNR